MHAQRTSVIHGSNTQPELHPPAPQNTSTRTPHHEWTDRTWNPTTGCTRVSPGCDHCYAERFAERFRGSAGHPYELGFDLRLRPSRLGDPARWMKPQRVFVNAMSDLFHTRVPDTFIHRVFDTMEEATHHIYQLLTKRSARMRRFVCNRYGHAGAPEHIWMGVSIESPKYMVRLDHLHDTPCRIRFSSCEPLLADLPRLDLHRRHIHWVIAGGESGPHARPVESDWIRHIRDECIATGTAFFFKQWGGPHPTSRGRILDGRTWDQSPPQPRP